MAILSFLATTIRLIFIMCIFIGMFYVSHKKLHIILEFTPIFVFSSIAVFVFTCGIIRLLLPAVFIVCGFGVSCFYFMIKTIVTHQNKKFLLKGYLQKFSGVHVAFLVGALFFLIEMLNTHLMHYDNYSHWATVVKEMLITKSFPTADSAMVEFKNYPLGMSSFVYFFCEIVGNGQPVMLLAQGLIVFSCFFALFGIITETKRVLLYLLLATGCSMLSIFNITIRINNLLVDFVLPILGLAVIAVIYRYRFEVNKIHILIVPMIGFLIIVKNTGIIYAAFAIMYLFYILIKDRKRSTVSNLLQIEGLNIKVKGHTISMLFKTIIAVALSMITTILWNIHMKLNFSDVDNKFELDGNVMQGIYAGKTEEDVKQIIDLFISTIMDITLRPTIGVVLFNVLAILLCVVGFIVTKKKWQLPKAIISLNIMLVIYYLGILAMYIFSMPLVEAIYLAGFERYACSIVIFFGGALTMCATIDFENSFHVQIGNRADYRSFKNIDCKKAYNIGVVICLSLSALILESEFNGLNYQQSLYEESLPAKVQSVVGDYWGDEVDDTKYLVYASDTDAQVTSYYLQYLTKYYLRANQVDGICYFYEDNMLNLLSKYDKLIIIESDEEQKALMKKYLNETGEAGIYELHKND